jgi:hypothetical protein
MQTRKMSFSEFETMSVSEMRGIMAGSGTLVSTPSISINPFINDNWQNLYQFMQPNGSGSYNYSAIDLMSSLWNVTPSGGTLNFSTYAEICLCTLSLPKSITGQNENSCVPTTLSFVSGLFGGQISISTIENLFKSSGLNYTSKTGLTATTDELITFIKNNFYTDSVNYFAGDSICAGYAVFAQMKIKDVFTDNGDPYYHAISFVKWDKLNNIFTFMDPATGRYGTMTLLEYNTYGVIRPGSVIGIKGYKPH